MRCRIPGTGLSGLDRLCVRNLRARTQAEQRELESGGWIPPRELTALIMNPRLAIALLAFVLATQSTKVVAEGTIHFLINDKDGNQTPCRIHLFAGDGKPQVVKEFPYWYDHFVCPGDARVNVPAGHYKWQIERGPEHDRQEGKVTVKENEASEVAVVLSRIANLRSERWFSGDLHVHRPVGDMKLLMQAEDLNFAPVIQWWNNRGKGLGKVSETNVHFDQVRTYQLMAGEDEREGGALLYFGLNEPLDLTAESREFPSPMFFASEARKRNHDVWIDIEKPFWWDVPTWLASGQMNSIGIANNHMCRDQMLENEAWGKPRDITRLPGPTGNGYWTQEIYYHALNCGLRIPPSAGSASGVLPNPVGYNRVYVQADAQPTTGKEYFQALATGRCFVTNGPLLRVSANGNSPGKVFKLSRANELTVNLDISLSSNDPVSELEVIHNGRIIKRIPCEKVTSQSISETIFVEQPGWFLVRAIADVDHTFRFASTAPWYVDGENGQLPISEVSSRFFLNWVKERMQRLREEKPENLFSLLTHHESALVLWRTKVELVHAMLGSKDEDVVQLTSARARRLPMCDDVESQPLLAAIDRLIEAKEYVGSPMPNDVVTELRKLSSLKDSAVVTQRVQELLDPLCLAGVSIQADGPPMVKPGNTERKLLEQGWRTFLVKVVNKPGVTRRLLVESPNAQPLPHSPLDQVSSRWMQLSSFEGRPLKPNLSGLGLEYRILQIYSRDAGPKKALLEFTVSNKAGEDGALVREWRFDKDADGWHAMNQVDLKVRDGSLHVTSTGDDPFIGADAKARGGAMLLRFWAKSEVDGIGQVFWWTKDRPQATGDRQTNYILEPGEEKLYEVPFSVAGELAGVRIDPLVKKGKVRIDWIDLYSAERTKNWTKLPLDFDCEAATPVTLHVKDSGDLPAFAKFEIRDAKGRIYPAQSKRLAPDFFFQRHIYRGNGETVSLPPGEYTIQCSRGPETVPETKALTVGAKPTDLRYEVKRWIDPSVRGWWSGDHHIHAAGCLHYNNPTEGVKPGDMIRHIMGEDLKVGCCLTWGPCFDYQKRFFTGEAAQQSRYPYILRYDVEVSGFGSHMSGHLNLLNLKQQIYPGGESKDHWPTLGLNTLRWAKRQGAVCGPAHSSIGLTNFVGRLPDTDGKDGPHGLPNFQIPTFDGIGANEFIVDVTHKVPGANGDPVSAVDFISTMNTERVAEWNMWYHVLNCGFRVAASGETDFPCMSGERVGIGRVYAKVDGELTFEKWVDSIGHGRSYVSDGYCHLLDYEAKSATGAKVEIGLGGSELKLARPTEVRFSVNAAARFEGQKELTAELIVNGYPVAEKAFMPNGELQEITFAHELQSSSWVAIRVFPNAHTNPIFVVIDDQPVRGTLDSARWCLAGVQQCWKSKQHTYATDEQDDAKAAYEHAKKVYESLLK